MSNTRKHRAVAKIAGVAASDLELESWDHYGLELYSIGGGSEYAVGTDREVDAAAAAYIESSLWAFNSSFLAEYTDLSETLFQSLSGNYEDANPDILTLVERADGGLEGFVAAAISADGRGHFLSSYDGVEHAVRVGGVTYYVVRVN